MSETEQDQDATPRFSKAMLGRILAVAFFVSLGTFAVIQSMRGSAAPNAVNATVNLIPASDGGYKDQPGTGMTGVAAKQTKDGSSNTTNFPASTFDPAATAKSKSTGFEPKTFTPPAAKLPSNAATPNNKSFGGSAFGGSSFGSSSANSFSPANQLTPPDAKKNPAGSKKPAVTSKPATKPPARYAQANTGVPIIGNNSGFGSRQDRPATSKPTIPTNTFGDISANKPLDATAKTTADAAAKLKANVSNAASDLLKDVAKKGEAAADSMKQSIGGGFGPALPKSTGAFAGPPAVQSQSRLEPPKIQSVFGERPSAPPLDPNQNVSPKKTAQQNNSGFNAGGNLQPVRPITSQLSKNNDALLPKTNQFGDSNGLPATRANPMPTQGSTAPMTQRSNVPVQPISTNLSSIPRTPTSQPIPTRPFENDNSPSTRRPVDNISSRLGNGSPNLPTNSSSLTKNSPGDRQLDGIQAAAITVEKLSPREIQVNQTANFEIVIKNVGRSNAEDVHVFDSIPTGTEFEGASPKPTRISPDQTVEWNLGQLRPGQEKRIKLQLKPIQPGEIGSVAQVTFAAQASMRTLVTKPILEIVHQTNPTHLIGDNVILDVVVTNKGDGAAKNVMIQQDVPPQLDFPDGLPGASRGIEYEIGTLMPGKSRRVKLALKAKDIGKIQNVMFASADGGLRAQHLLPIEVVSPNLVVRSEGATKGFLKRDVTHQFSVANRGTAKATNVELIARLPRGLRFIQSNNQGRYDASTHAVYWSLAELARDVEAKVELNTMPVDVGSQPIKFESTADLKIRSNVEQALSVEHFVDVFFDIDDVVDPIEIGSDTSYRLRVVNQGTKAASNVQIEVDFPPGLQPTSVDGSLRHNIRGQQIVFEPINSMNPGDEIGFVIHGKGISAGDHRVIVNMRTDGRATAVSKQESTRVYSDR